jgi:hypothetical protein
MIVSSLIKVCKKCKKNFYHSDLDDGMLDDYCSSCRKELLEEDDF